MMVYGIIIKREKNMKFFLKMNLPNKLTTLRMLAVIVLLIIALFPWGLINGTSYNGTFIEKWYAATNNSKEEWVRYTMLIIFALASFTDFLDGYIARKNNLVTTYGKFMDPIADKLLVNSILILFAAWHLIPVECAVIMIARDIFVDALRLIGIQKGKVIAANKWGKAKTVAQMISIIIILIPVTMDFPLNFILIYLATFISLVSGIKYFTMNYKELFSEQK